MGMNEEMVGGLEAFQANAHGSTEAEETRIGPINIGLQSEVVIHWNHCIGQSYILNSFIPTRPVAPEPIVKCNSRPCSYD